MTIKPRIRPAESPRPVIPCAHDGCPNPAILYRKLPTGWAKLCKEHDLFHVQQEANDFCRANDLTDRKKQLAFIREKLKAPRVSPAVHWERVLQTHGLPLVAYEMAKRYLGRFTTEREPGEDDEVAA